MSRTTAPQVAQIAGQIWTIYQSHAHLFSTMSADELKTLQKAGEDSLMSSEFTERTAGEIVRTAAVLELEKRGVK